MKILLWLFTLHRARQFHREVELALRGGVRLSALPRLYRKGLALERAQVLSGDLGARLVSFQIDSLHRAGVTQHGVDKSRFHTYTGMFALNM